MLLEVSHYPPVNHFSFLICTLPVFLTLPFPGCVLVQISQLTARSLYRFSRLLITCGAWILPG